VAPQSGVSQPVQILDEPATPPAALAPEAPVKITGPATLAAPVAPASPSVLTITPRAPNAPPALAIVPLTPARRELMIKALKDSQLARKNMIMVAPMAPTMAIIAPRAGYGVGYGYGVG